MVMHFPVTQEEITLSITPLRVSLRNYYEEGYGELALDRVLTQTKDRAAGHTFINCQKVATALRLTFQRLLIQM